MTVNTFLLFIAMAVWAALLVYVNTKAVDTFMKRYTIYAFYMLSTMAVFLISFCMLETLKGMVK